MRPIRGANPRLNRSPRYQCASASRPTPGIQASTTSAAPTYRGKLYTATVPIYEYVCMKCEHHFEELVHGDEAPACPSCAAKKVTRKYSSFATVGGPSKSCGSCAGGNCGGCGGH